MVFDKFHKAIKTEKKTNGIVKKIDFKNEKESYSVFKNRRLV